MKNKFKRFLAALLCLALLPCLPAAGGEEILPVLQLEEASVPAGENTPEAPAEDAAPEELPVEGEVPPAPEETEACTLDPTAQMEPAVTPVPTASPAPEEESLPQVITMQQVASELLEDDADSGIPGPDATDAPADEFEIADNALLSYLGSKEIVEVPEGIEIIAENAFLNHEEITAVVLPETVREICAGAFSGCINLAEINLPDSIAAIADDAFSGCTRLQAGVKYGSYAADYLNRSGIRLNYTDLPESISFTQSTLYIGYGDEFDLKQLIRLNPDECADELKFVSFLPNVVGVSEDGVIKGNWVGNSYVTATTVNGLMAYIRVYVFYLPGANRFNVWPANQVLAQGAQTKLNVYFSSNFYALHSFTSSDDSVARVDANGNVTAVGPGTATIRASLVQNPEVYKTATITVKPAPQSISGSTDKLTLLAGQSSKAFYGVNPDSQNSLCTFVYSSSDENVVTVNASTGEIKAVGMGKAVVTVRANNNENASAQCEVSVVELASSQFSFGVGDTMNIRKLIRHPDGEDAGEYIFYSSNNKVISVDANGNFTGLRYGAAYVVAYNAEGLYIPLTVLCWNSAPASKMALNPATLILGEGMTGQLTPVFASGYYGLYTLSSSDENIAKVYADGKVEAVGLGEATITMSLVKNPAVQKTAQVKVMGVPDAIEASVSELTLGVGQASTALYGINPTADTTLCSFVYSSSAPEIAEVDPSTGKITAKAPGAAIITVAANNNPAATAECVVTVREAPASIAFAEPHIYIGRGDTFDISTLVQMPEGTAAGLSYASSYPAYVSITPDGKVTGLRSGGSYITVATHNGLWARMIVFVQTLPTAKQMALNPATLILGEGMTGQLTPVFASGYYGLYTLSSSDENIVKVNNDGVVEAVGLGEATITMSLVKNPAVQKTAQVKVMGVPDAIEASVSELTLGVGQMSTALCGVNPASDTTLCSFVYSSSAQEIAEVDPSTGKITAKAPGAAIITVAANNNPAATAECVVTVREAPASIAFAEPHIYIGRGDTFDISTLVQMPEGTAAGLSYASSYPAYVSITPDGKVTGLCSGGSYITVATHNGLWARMIVFVQTLPSAKQMALNPATLILGEGMTGQLTTVFASGYYGLYTLSSSDENIAKVNNDGVVEAMGLGEATITMSLVKNPAVQKTAQVKVMGVPDAIEASVSELTLGVGQTSTALYGVNPTSDATLCSFVYSSTAPEIAEVDPSTGKITAKAPGAAIITVAANNNPAATAECVVTVKPAPESIRFDNTRTIIGQWEQVQLDYHLLPEGSAGGFSFYSSKPSIATISADGVVTGWRVGWTIITVMAHNNVYGQFILYVQSAPAKVYLSADKKVLGAGEELQFTATIGGNRPGTYSYSSSDADVLAVDAATGLARAVGEGTARITVTTYNGVSAWLDITVLPAPAEITLSRESAVLGAGDSLTVSAQINEGAAGNHRFYSLNPDVAEVDELSGRITAKKEGTAMIMAETYNGVADALSLQVVAAPDALYLRGLEMQDGVYHLTIERTESHQLELDAGLITDLTVSYAASAGKISVDAEGRITAIANGSDTLTVTAYNGTAAVVEITVPGVMDVYPEAQTIMHAMGSIDGLTYSNSRDAFLSNYAKGHRLFEVDFSFTSDGGLVLWHNWTSNRINSSVKAGYVPTLAEFEKMLVFDRYDSLTCSDLLRLMNQYPDVFIFMDTKYTDVNVAKTQYNIIISTAKELGLEHVLDRMVVMIYNAKMYTAISSMHPFKHYVLMCYKLFSKKPTASQVLTAMQFCSLNGIEIFSTWDSWWNPAYMVWAEQYGLTVNLHTVNSEASAQKYIQQGVKLITSDHLGAKILAQ